MPNHQRNEKFRNQSFCLFQPFHWKYSVYIHFFFTSFVLFVKLHLCSSYIVNFDVIDVFFFKLPHLISSKISGFSCSRCFMRSRIAVMIELALSSAPCFELFSAAPKRNKYQKKKTTNRKKRKREREEKKKISNYFVSPLVGIE